MDFFKTLLSQGKTQFHVVEACKDYLDKSGFKCISPDYGFKDIQPGKYYISPFSSMLIPFVIGKNPTSVRFAAAHTDFPMLKLKCNPEINKKEYLQVNIEPYGGLIKESWFDRPLGLAGKVIIKGKSAFEPETLLFDSHKPLFVIPNLAPHLKHNSSASEMDISKEMIPIYGMAGNVKEPESVNNCKINKRILLDYISNDLQIEEANILDYDLYLYISENASTLGLWDEFILGARIDNISSVAAIIETICSAEINNSIVIGALFDNEEIGSRSKQGADSYLLRDLAEQIIPDRKLLYKAFNLSVDVAHATHPNYCEKSDITNDIILGNGVVLKSSASQRYVTDSEAGAVIEALSRDNGIKIQRQVNRSGMPGGQTLGPIMSSYLPVKSVDIGIPMLAMHSAGELIHKDDYLELIKLLTAYFEY